MKKVVIRVSRDKKTGKPMYIGTKEIEVPDAKPAKKLKKKSNLFSKLFADNDELSGQFKNFLKGKK